jgi:hypothetical protein
MSVLELVGERRALKKDAHCFWVGEGGCLEAGDGRAFSKR